MTDYFYSLYPMVPYLMAFPILLIIFSVAIYVFISREISDRTVGFYGLFINLSNRKIAAISFIIVYYFIFISSIVVSKYSIINLFVLLALAILANIVVLNIKYSVGAVFFTIFMYYIIYFQKMFINYVIDIDNLWYLDILIVFMSAFSFGAITLFVMKNTCSIAAYKK